MKATIGIAAAAMLSMAVPSTAQDKKVDFNIGGGYNLVTGEARKHAGDGGLFEVGATFNITPALGVQANYDYTALGKEKTVNLQVGVTPGGPTTTQQFSADFHMHEANFNLVFKPKPTGFYGLAGPGVYHRTINITTPAVGYTTICDPWWYVCYPAAVAVDQVLGTRSSTDMGINVGVGASFPIGETVRGYFEIRYVYVWGPSVDVPAIGSNPAKTLSANGQFTPFIFGFRF